MKKALLGSLAMAGVVFVGASALAHGGGKGGGWERMDANGDGEVTADEMAGRSEALLAAADTDNSGGVSKDEMKAYRKARREARREERNPDKNDDGVIDKTEFLAAAQERFDRMDKDGNGVISEDEQRRKGRRGHRRGE